VTALQAASKAAPLLQTPGHFESAEYHFYDALSRAAQYDASSPEERTGHRKALAADREQIVVLAENCSENFGNRAALVSAELARIEGRDLDAMHLYEEAIRSARENSFIQNEAVAYEIAARFYDARGSRHSLNLTSGKRATATFVGEPAVRCGNLRRYILT
jgi:hypothetical protein